MTGQAATRAGPGVLEGQTALVTGANSGIGEAVARNLAAGAAVVVNHVSQPEADQGVGRIQAAGGRAVAMRADVTSEDEVRAMVARTVETFGTFNILVNNAGIQRDAALVDITLDDWNRVIAVNLTGAFLSTREAAREFIRRGVRPAVSRAAGKILFISSVHELIPCRARQLCRQQGRADAAHAERGPGARPVPRLRQQHRAGRDQDAHQPPGLGDARGRGETASSDTLRPCRPPGRHRAVVWLASDDADYVHGATLFVDEA